MEDLVIWPDSRLSKVCQPVTTFDPQVLQEVTSRMFLNMRHSQGIGIAAPQVGSNLRIIMWDTKKISGDQPDGTLVNPEIVWHSDGVVPSQEGCLSFPGLTVSVPRWEKIQFRGYDIYGTPKGFDVETGPYEAEGLVAFCIQHEIDHLDGRNIVDGLSKVKRDILRAKITKWKKYNGTI